ncbi:uncharacterized protein KGF55_004781 [Candida pseudojiufengensis]|uniref:uncharacterized protein n=1 Tax=Candida pseudojiufengensis TaxID=497109 RepID=UPI0022254822|nr:uncharacterized protein KGF55_004781 [Candida pseudojiufengensis]KAI5960058.1 hypothetical protein KGF55_004781 [Candida pseudojiufengensis]
MKETRESRKRDKEELLGFSTSKNRPRNINNLHELLPGLNDISDAFEALPLDIIKYFTLLKEIDAKCINTIPQINLRIKNYIDNLHSKNNESLKQKQNQDHQQLNIIKNKINEIIPCLEEKMHVTSVATDLLNKHMYRINQDYKLIIQNNEIPENIRIGPLIHPAMILDTNNSNNSNINNGNNNNNNSNNINNSINSQRSESRREALAARKSNKDDDKDSGTGGTPSTSNAGRKKKNKEQTPLENNTSTNTTSNNNPKSLNNDPKKRRNNANDEKSNKKKKKNENNNNDDDELNNYDNSNMTNNSINSNSLTSSSNQSIQQQTKNKNLSIDGGNNSKSIKNEPTYCYCNQVSFGEMVGCDGDDCKREWFHLPCIGFKNPPKGKWYCDDCIIKIKKNKKY